MELLSLWLTTLVVLHVNLRFWLPALTFLSRGLLASCGSSDASLAFFVALSRLSSGEHFDLLLLTPLHVARKSFFRVFAHCIPERAQHFQESMCGHVCQESMYV